MRKLSTREINIAVIAGLIVGGAMAWSGIVAPSLASRANSFAQLRKVDILWTVLDQLPASLQGTRAAPSQSLRERVTASARAASIDIRRLDPQGPALSVSLDDVAFTALIGWLETLTTRSGVRVFSAEIGRRPEPGVVSARIVMEEAS